MTIILVSHSMEDVAKLVDRIIVMNRGKIALIGTPRQVFMQAEKLEEMGLSVPQVTYLVRKLKAKGFNIRQDVITVEEAKNELLRCLKGREK
jgi:energy-coupling factor transport system ATP-binding protein